MKVNTLEIEWTDTGCVAKATGFKGVMLTCPRCQELLPRDTEHCCGDKKINPIKTKNNLPAKGRAPA